MCFPLFKGWNSDTRLLNLFSEIYIYSQLLLSPSLFLVSFLISFFLKLTVAFRWCVIYVREDDDSNVKAMVTRLIWTTWTLMSTVPKKAVKLNHSLTLVISRPVNWWKSFTWIHPSYPEFYWLTTRCCPHDGHGSTATCLWWAHFSTCRFIPSDATHFTLSHPIEMHNSHLLGDVVTMLLNLTLMKHWLPIGVR